MQACRFLPIAILLLGLSSCIASRADNSIAGDLDLSTPASTVLSYCNSENLEIVRQCFDDDARLEPTIATRIWSSCRIADVRRSPLQDDGYVYAREGDMEVVTEVRMIDLKRGNPLTSFWYLLRLKGDAWKIIANSHIPDANYPAID